MDAENHVKIISKVIIKPSSPTPHTHKTVKLSFLDQLLAPPFYVPFIFFYQPDNSTVSVNHAQISQQLKNSLSEALTLFYPLAGKLNPQISTVDCSDDGAEFVEARVHTYKFLRLRRNSYRDLLVAPINRRRLPGGVCRFVGRGLPRAGAKRIEKRKAGDEKIRVRQGKIGGAKTRRCFRPTRVVGREGTDRVEVVSAFIWKHFIENGHHVKNVPAAWHIVNLRPRVNPTMENVFGNFILKKFIFSSGADPEFRDLVSEMRNGLREIDDEYIRKLSREYDGYVSDISKFYDLVVSGEMESVGFSSWARFPVYDMDYGWGKPVWVCPTSCPEKNVVFLMGTKDGDGIEAWVNMLESSSEILEIKFKLLGIN
ncbi:hypothetical protein DH2020_011126 [Rehmannia glutinosa]|uniref:Vinorine synthase n=1 Tax=Rehmannia glutinosa TaxID=99300 RepID=A0ABR0XCF9_REHGL